MKDWPEGSGDDAGDQACRPADPALASDAARIGAELLRLDGGTDPFAAAVRATRMPMIITDPRQPDNPVVFVNDAFARLSGYRREEIVGRNCRFLQGPETNPEDVARIRGAVARRQAFHGDIRNHRKDGEPFWNRLLLAPVRDARGDVAYFFASQVDVTLERERLSNLEGSNASLMAEVTDRARALAESEARFRFAASAGRMGVWEFDLATGELTTSSYCRENFGRDERASFTYDELRAAVHPDDRARMAEAVEHSVTTGADYDIEYRVVRPDRSLGWVQVRAQVQRDEAGRPTRMVGVSLDTTMRRDAEEALRASEARYRQLFEAMDEGFCIIEFLDGPHGPLSDYVHLEANGAFARHAGLPDVVGRRLRETVPEEAEGWLARYRPVLLTGAPVRFERELVATGRILELSAFRIEPASRRQVAVLFQDVTAQRRDEAALRDLNATLEARVEARTAELREREGQLAQVQKMEAVGQLAGGIAHDLNNMLQGVSSALELMRRRIDAGRPQEAGRYVEAARQSIGRAAALTHRLLAFSRRQTLVPTRVEVDALVSGIADLIRQTIGPGIALTLNRKDRVWAVYGDASGLENAVLNLAINARDAMPDGGRLTVETAHATLSAADVAAFDGAEAGDYVRITVTDTGEGMTPQVLAHAFEPFFTTKPQGKGTGLGLSQVYGFVRQSGGLLRIDSEVGRGTAVHIYLPRHDRPETERSMAAPRPPASADDMLQAQVLLVEDEAAVRSMAAEALRDMGCEVVEAENSLEGLAALRRAGMQGGFDLLVTDVGLPGGMNGRQLADAARELMPGLPVLLVTGYAGEAVAGQDLAPGMHLLGKPFTLDALTANVRAVLPKTG